MFLCRRSQSEFGASMRSESKRSAGKIKWRILFLLGMGLSVTLATTLLTVNYLLHIHISDELQKDLNSVERLFEQLLVSESDALKAQLGFIKNDTVLQKHWLTLVSRGKI